MEGVGDSGEAVNDGAEDEAKREVLRQLWDDSNNLMFTPLGSGREVGRSCHILEFKGKRIMLDCGIHPGRKGEELLPFFDRIPFPIDELDLILITHFHLDHAASLPYLMQVSLSRKFKGAVYMTSSTKAVLRLVLKDYARILAAEPGESPMYTQEDVQRCLDRCQTIGFHQALEIDGVKITPYHAGHVLGAAMFLIEIAGVKVLYTGDYSREDDRHLRGAEIPSVRPDVLIVEATFGLMVHEGREQREKRFTEAVEKVVRRGGNCLIPMGALGATQELLLILEDYWNKNPHLKGVPIYHTSRIANEALSIYRSFITAMNDNMKRLQYTDPWNFENIDSLGETEEIVGPAVVIASPGYLQSGKSRRLFEMWCPDRKNGVILAGYSVEGTLAKDLSREGFVREVVSMNGTLLNVECEVKTITFAAHSDFIGTKSFVEQLKPKNIIFVHGEEEQMRRLKNKLLHDAQAAGQECEFFNPDNCKTVTLQFQEQRIVKAYGGELVQQRMRTKGNRVAAYLVRKDFSDRLIATEDIRLYTQLKTAVVTQKLHLPFHPKFALLESCVAKMFKPSPAPSGAPETLTVASGAIELALKNNVVCVTWEASPSNDMIVDALTAIIMQAESGIPAVRIGTCCSAHAHSTKPPPPKVRIIEEKEEGDGEGENAMVDENFQAQAQAQQDDQPASDNQEQQKDQQDPIEPGAPLASVLESSPSAAFLLRLLEEKYGEDEVEKKEDLLRIAADEQRVVEIRFKEDGHISSITRSGDDAIDIESDVQQTAILANQTLHSLR